MTSGIATHLKLQRLWKPLYISAVSISRWAVPICYRRCVTGSVLLGHRSCLPSAALGSSSSTVISLLDFCGAESPQLNSNGGRWMIWCVFGVKIRKLYPSGLKSLCKRYKLYLNGIKLHLNGIKLDVSSLKTMQAI